VACERIYLLASLLYFSSSYYIRYSMPKGLMASPPCSSPTSTTRKFAHGWWILMSVLRLQTHSSLLFYSILFYLLPSFSLLFSTPPSPVPGVPHCTKQQRGCRGLRRPARAHPRHLAPPEGSPAQAPHFEGLRAGDAPRRGAFQRRPQSGKAKI